METQSLQSERVDILSWTGKFGKWQLQVIIIVMVITQVPVVWPVFLGIFQAPTIDYWCARPPGFENWTVKQWRRLSSPLIKQGNRMVHDKCHMYNLSYADMDKEPGNYSVNANTTTMACTRWEWDRTQFTNTIVNTWHLFCEKEKLAILSQTLFMLGFLIGSVGAGVVSDKFGRKMTVTVAIVLLLLAEILTAYTPWYELFLILQFIIGVTRIAVTMAAYTLAMELIGERHRTMCGMVYNYFWSLGYVSLVGIAYFVRDWTHLQLITTGISIVTFSLYWLLPESPRWQLSTGRVEEAEETVKAAMRKNGKPIPDSFKLAAPKSSETKATVVDLFRTWNMRKNTCVMCFIWCVCSWIYYGLSFGAGDLAGDIFLNIVLVAVIEIPATTVSMTAILKMGRKFPLCFFLVLGGGACLSTVAIPSGSYAYNWPVVTLAVIGKFGISASFSILWVYSLEMYPTIVRTVGVGTNSMCARVGSIAAPFMRTLDDVYPHLAITIFAVPSFVAGFMVLLLPETKKCRLPDNMEDGEQLGMENRRRRWFPGRKIINADHEPVNANSHS